MIQVIFKNMRKSDFVIEAVQSRIEPYFDKFEDLKASRLTATIEMENSPAQAGPDLFKIRLRIMNGRYRGLAIEKSNSNFYYALSDVSEHLLELLNRAGDKMRVRNLKSARRIQSRAAATELGEDDSASA